MIVIGIDPGKTTGIAVYDHDATTMLGVQIAFDDFGDWLNISLSNLVAQDVTIACERFAITAGTFKKSQDAHWALEAIGVTRYLTHCYGRSLILQTAGSAKSFASDAKLRIAQWYVPGHDHANDAIRHVALALASMKIAPPWAR